MRVSLLPFSSSRRGQGTLKAIIGLLALAAAAVIVVISLMNGGKSIISRYDVEGTVTTAPGVKQKFGEGSEAKFAINLETASGPVIVNCTSTQCSSLAVGQRVRLSCYEETHISAPNEEECRFDKLLPKVAAQ